MPNIEYLDQFKSCVDVTKAYGGTPGSHPGLTKDVIAEMIGVDMSTYYSGVTSDQSKAARNIDRERYLAYLFISGACSVRYGSMKRDLHNEYLKEKDAHPKKFEAALKYMNDYQTLNNPGGYKKPQRKDKEA